MLPNSRINSWESWFIFNLQKNKQISHTDNLRHLVNESIIQVIFSILDLSFTFSKWIIASYSLYTFYTFYTYFSGYPLQHLANMSILASSWGQTEPFASLLLSCILLVCLCPPSSLLFVPTIYISHAHPHLTTRWLNTIIQVNNMGAWHLMYTRRQKTWALKIELLHLWQWVHASGR